MYLGEYAANGNNELDRALAEGIHLCNVERNGDVVEMTSYAPLLCKDGYHNWNPDMIYFDNSEKSDSPRVTRCRRCLVSIPVILILYLV